jgi:hypothetical protein
MEEPGEHYTVVFVLIVTEPASEGVCGGGIRRVGVASNTPLLPLAGSEPLTA